MNEENNDINTIELIKKSLKKVGLKTNNIKRDNSYPNSYIVEYDSFGTFSLKTFKDLEKLTNSMITFKPHTNMLYIWFNFS